MSIGTIGAVGEFSAMGSRESQEDSLWTSQEKGLFIVADGFGGPVHGAQAAKQACEEIRRFLIRESHDLEATMPYIMRSYYSLSANVLFNSLLHANRRAIKNNKNKSIQERGGASVIAGYLDGSLLSIANVGACEAWLLREGQFTELVIPRTLRRLKDPFMKDGFYTKGGQKGATQWDIPLCSLGTSEDLEPEIVEVQIRPWDALILSTDGMSADRTKTLELLKWFAQLLETGRLGSGSTASSKEIAQEFTQDFLKQLEKQNWTDNTSASVVIF